MGLTTDAVLKIVERETLMVGNAWRASWAEFDGRTLLQQLADLARWARNSQSQDYRDGTKFYIAHWIDCGATEEEARRYAAELEAQINAGQF